MSSFQEVPSSANALQTSNFAHVIFQNVAKSYLPNTHLECHYTLTQFIHPHQKDWVGIFKVSQACSVAVSQMFPVFSLTSLKKVKKKPKPVKAFSHKMKCSIT